MTEPHERHRLANKERFDVRVVREFLRRWPLDVGKGFILRLCRPVWETSTLPVEIEPGVWVRARFHDYVFRWAFVNGFHCRPEIALSRKLIVPGNVIIDAGANIGLWTLGAARRVGPEGTVHAFEPIPDNYAELVSNVRVNGLSQVHSLPVGLSDRTGQATIYATSNGNSGMASLAPSPGVDQAFEIELTTLDEYCAQHAIARVDFLKLDVEGAELAVLDGAQSMLKQEPMILFEVSEQTARAFGRSTIDVKARLSEHGFRLFRVGSRRLERVAVREMHEHNEDLLALTPTHLERSEVLRELVGGW